MTRLSKVHRLMGELDRAVELCRESQAMCQEIGYRKGEILALISCGDVALERGEFPKAEAAFRESSDTSQDVGFISGAVQALIGLGRTALRRQQFALAQERLQKALGMSSENYLHRSELSALVALAEVLIASGAKDKGGEFLALATDHPAADRHTKLRAEQALEKLRARVDPTTFEATVARGRGLTLAAVREVHRGDG